MMSNLDEKESYAPVTLTLTIKPQVLTWYSLARILLPWAMGQPVGSNPIGRSTEKVAHAKRCAAYQFPGNCPVTCIRSRFEFRFNHFPAPSLPNTASGIKLSSECGGVLGNAIF